MNDQKRVDTKLNTVTERTTVRRNRSPIGVPKAGYIILTPIDQKNSNKSRF